MIAIINSLPVREGAAEEVAGRFGASRGHVQDFPGFVSMEVLRSEQDDEVLVITRWQDRASFDAWVGSEEFSKAHARGGMRELMRGHPKMTSYEVSVEREPRGARERRSQGPKAPKSSGRQLRGSLQGRSCTGLVLSLAEHGEGEGKEEDQDQDHNPERQGLAHLDLLS